MTTIKISEIAELRDAKANFKFLGVDMSDRASPINNTISYNTLSTNIYDITYDAAHKEIELSVRKLSDDLSADLSTNAIYNEGEFKKLRDSITSKADKTNLKQLSDEFYTISGLLCTDLGLSVNNLSSELTAQADKINNVEAQIPSKIDILSISLTSELSVIASDATIGMVKCRITEPDPTDLDYTLYGLAVDETGGAYVKIPNSSGGGGSTPLDYGTVQVSAAHGKAANILLTDIDNENNLHIKDLSNTYRWYYKDGDTTVYLNSVKDELAKLKEDTKYNCVKFTDGATKDKAGIILLGYTLKDNNYPLLTNADGRAYVTVPNSGSSYELSTATDTILGGIKIGYVSTNNNYAVNIATEGANAGRAYVTVPSGNITTATSTALGGIKIGYPQSGNNYPVQIAEAGDNVGKAFVTVPNTGTLTTEMLKQIYPVGSVYTSTRTTIPFDFGTWENITDSSAEKWTTKTIYAFERTA